MNLLIGFLNYSSSRKGERLARIIYYLSCCLEDSFECFGVIERQVS